MTPLQAIVLIFIGAGIGATFAYFIPLNASPQQENLVPNDDTEKKRPINTINRTLKFI